MYELDILRKDYDEFRKYGGVFVPVAPPIEGHPKSGKNPIGVGWQNKDSLTWEECLDNFEKNRNLGVLLTSSESSLVCIDCDCDSPEDLYENQDFSDFFLGDTLVCRAEKSTLRYKAFYHITDIENLDKIPRHINKISGKLPSEYEIFVPRGDTRQCVVAPSTHAMRGKVVSNAHEIKGITVQEFRDLVLRVTGGDIFVICEKPQLDKAPQIVDKKNPKQKSELKEFPNIQDLMLPYLKDPRPSAGGWVNGVITDGNGVNAGYHVGKNCFKCFAGKGRFAGSCGGAITFYALANGIDPRNKKDILRQLAIDGYAKFDEAAFVRDINLRTELQEERAKDLQLNAIEKLEEVKLSENESALKFVEDTIHIKHVGDIYETRLLLLTSVMNKIQDCKSLMIFVGGETGSGKSDLANRFCEVLPQDFVNKTNVSPSVLWYLPPVPHTHLIIDEGAVYNAFQDWIKLSTSDWDKPEKKQTLVPTTVGQTAVEQWSPIRCTIYSFRYEATGDEQIQNRSLQITLQVTPEKLQAVKYHACCEATGELYDVYDEYEKRLEVCHTYYEAVPMVRVIIPFAHRIIEASAFQGNRLRYHYYGLIRAFCLWRHMGKEKLEEGQVLTATEEDFWNFVDLMKGLETGKSYRVDDRAGEATSLRDFIYTHDWRSDPDVKIMDCDRVLISVASLREKFGSMSKTGIYYALFGRSGNKHGGLIGKSPALTLADGENFELPDGTKLRSNALYLIIDLKRLTNSENLKTYNEWGLMEEES